VHNRAFNVRKLDLGCEASEYNGGCTWKPFTYSMYPLSIQPASQKSSKNDYACLFVCTLSFHFKQVSHLILNMYPWIPFPRNYNLQSPSPFLTNQLSNCIDLVWTNKLFLSRVSSSIFKLTHAHADLSLHLGFIVAIFHCQKIWWESHWFGCNSELHSYMYYIVG